MNMDVRRKMIFHEDSCVSLDIESSDDWEGRGGAVISLSVRTNKQTNCTGWHCCILCMRLSPLKLRRSYDFVIVQYNYTHMAEWLDTVS